LSPHAWNPALQVKPQTPTWHVVVPLATSGHFTAQPPQCDVLVSGSTQSGPQRSGAAGEQPFVHMNVPPDGAQFGAAAGHGALHAPHEAAFERSVSHPSEPFALQSAHPGSQDLTAQVLVHVAVACVIRHGAQLGSPQP
jgi:hypothetical protein